MIERLWRLLPDRCEVVGCRRQCARGDETMVAGRFACPDCYTREGHLHFKTWPRRQLLARNTILAITLALLIFVVWPR